MQSRLRILHHRSHLCALPQWCTFLQDRILEDHPYVGHALRKMKGIFFNSGASGCFLSRVTLNGLLLRLDVGEEHFAMFTTSKWLQSNPGISTAECLGESMHVYPADTRDHKETHIFHSYGLMRTITWDVDDWFIKRHEGFNEIFGEVSIFQLASLLFLLCSNFLNYWCLISHLSLIRIQTIKPNQDHQKSVVRQIQCPFIISRLRKI